MAKARTAVPAVDTTSTAGHGLVDELDADRVAVPIPAGRVDADYAMRLTERIRLTAAGARERLVKLSELVAAARAGEVDDVLGYLSWTAYLADVLGGQLQLTSADERREIVSVLAGEGMSTAAIAPIVGASKATVARDVAQVSHGETPAKVTGVDGKTYTPPAAPRFPSLPGWTAIPSGKGRRCRACGFVTNDPARMTDHHEAGHPEPERPEAVTPGPWEEPTLDGHPAVARAMVPVRKADGGVIAECRHCEWTMAGHGPSEVELYVKHHRHQHQTGGIPVTKGTGAPAPEAAAAVLEVEPTPAMAKGEQLVWQCASCGTVVVVPGGRPDARVLGACPVCEEDRWWRQHLPVAGLRLVLAPMAAAS